MQLHSAVMLLYLVLWWVANIVSLRDEDILKQITLYTDL